MKKRNKILLFFTIYSVLIGSIEGYLYYIVHKGYELNLVSVILMARTSISSFFLNPNLSLGDAIETFRSYSAAPTAAFFTAGMAKILLYLYATVAVIAPLCTASVTLLFFESFLRTIKLKFHNNKLRRTILFGYNATTKRMLSNSSKKLEKGKIILVSSKELSREDRLSLLRQKVEVVEEDLTQIEDKNFTGFANKVKLSQADEIFIMEESTAQNFSLYMKLSSLGGQLIQKDTILCCQCEDASMVKWFIDYYNQHKTDCVAPKLFNLSHIRALNILESNPLPVKKDGQSIHILIAGLGSIGQSLLIEMINRSVYSGTNPIIIDVIDHNMNHKKDIFLRRFASEYADGSSNSLTIDGTQADGSLTINFHNLNISGRKFLDFLNGQAGFDYTAICIEKVEDSVICMEGLSEYAKKQPKKPFPIVTCLMTDPELTRYINHSRSEDNITVIGSKQYLSMENIVNRSLEESAKSFHALYNSLNIMSESEYKKQAAAPNPGAEPWEDVTQYKQDSSRFVALHQPIAVEMLKGAFAGKEKEQLEAWFGEHGSILQKRGNNYIYQGSMENLIAQVRQIPFLNQFGQMEHRRWLYMNAVRGWSYADTKNERTLQTPYMVTWDALYESYPYMCIYDLMPLLYEHQRL